MFKFRKTGIAFGGGAVRGFAHIGVIKALEENGLSFDCVTGNSAGGIVGALYDAGKTWRELYEIAAAVRPSDIIGLNLKRRGLFKTKKLEEFVRRIIGEVTFEQLQRQFRCVAVNLYDGRLVVFNEGPVAPAVCAGCCIPGIFEPLPYRNMLLIDGGLLNSVPADILLNMGARYRVAVNLNSDRGQLSPPKTGLDVLWSAFKIAWNENTKAHLAGVDLIIAPNLHGLNYYDLKQLNDLVRLGEQAMLKAIERLKKGMRKRVFSF